MSRLGEKYKPYLFILPHYLFFIAFFAIPTVSTLVISFCKWDFITPPRFVGLQNYHSLLGVAGGYYFNLFWNSFFNTLRYVVFSVPLLVVVPLLLAAALGSLKRGASFFQSIFYFPYLLSVSTVVLAWRWLLDRGFGAVNQILHLSVGWTVDQPYFWIAVLVLSVWWGLGGNLVIFIAGMADIPTDLYEAADLDGAGAVKKFFFITLPGLKNQLMYAVVMTTIASFNIYGQPVILANASTLTSDKNVLIAAIQHLAFGAVPQGGMASAMATLLGIIIMLVSLLQFKFSGSDD